MQNMEIITKSKRKPKSVLLDRNEHEAFKEYYLSFHTKMDAEDTIGLKRQILDGVFYRGSGRWDTIQKIRKVMRRKQAA
jgi:hypothetical protein